MFKSKAESKTYYFRCEECGDWYETSINEEKYNFSLLCTLHLLSKSKWF